MLWHMDRAVDELRLASGDSLAELGEDNHSEPYASVVSLGVHRRSGMAVRPWGRMARGRICGCPDCASEHAPSSDRTLLRLIAPE